MDALKVLLIIMPPGLAVGLAVKFPPIL